MKRGSGGKGKKSKSGNRKAAGSTLGKDYHFGKIRRINISAIGIRGVCLT